VTTPDPRRALDYARTNRERFVHELSRFVRHPTVSAQPRHAPDIARCAQWVAGELRRIGLERVSVVRTPRHPLVVGEWMHAPGRPTVLVYGHYDVQPVDPESAWTHPPFDPVVRDGYLHGRGSADDKGQLSAQLRAIESYLRACGGLPVNVRVLVDGEEEIGSPNLRPFLERNRDALRADVGVISDTRMLGPDRPALTYALRGSLSAELEISGPAHELHSGNFGGAVHNPIQVLAETLSGLHDRSGRVTIDGFYDRVQHVGAAERARMRREGPTPAEILRDAGVARGHGEQGYDAYERTTIRPAVTINGIGGGYQGPGGKAVIPERAWAKLNIRLVPHQDPLEIDCLLRAHLARTVPPGVRWRVARGAAARPATIDRTHPAMRAGAVAFRRGFGRTPAFVRSGGTIPVVNDFHDLLAIPTVLLGFALPGDRIHAPNERFMLRNFERGIATCIWFLFEVGAGYGRRPSRHLSRSPGFGARRWKSATSVS
jgi:acetylornithine deacetylase/succinyl-diaminopimelate desuccinylase-like protein